MAYLMYVLSSFFIQKVNILIIIKIFRSKQATNLILLSLMCSI